MHAHIHTESPRLSRAFILADTYVEAVVRGPIRPLARQLAQQVPDNVEAQFRTCYHSSRALRQCFSEPEGAAGNSDTTIKRTSNPTRTHANPYIAQNIAETYQKYFQSFIAIEILPQHFFQLLENILLQHYNFNFLKYFCE